MLLNMLMLLALNTQCLMWFLSCLTTVWVNSSYFIVMCNGIQWISYLHAFPQDDTLGRQCRYNHNYGFNEILLSLNCFLHDCMDRDIFNDAVCVDRIFFLWGGAVGKNCFQKYPYTHGWNLRLVSLVNIMTWRADNTPL